MAKILRQNIDKMPALQEECYKHEQATAYGTKVIKGLNLWAAV